MPDPFFASTKTRKRKRSTSVADGSSSRKPNSKLKAGGGGRAKSSTTTPSKRARALDEELSDKTSDDEGSIGDMDLRADDVDDGASGEEDENETPAEKRLRLAKLYLESVKSTLADGEYDAAEIDKELISSRLKKDVLEHSGKVHKFIADSFNFESPPAASLRVRGHRFSITSAVATESGKYLLTAGKEGNIIKWDLHTGKKLATFYKQRPEASTSAKGKGKGKVAGGAAAAIEGHTDEILGLAVSGDEKLLASAGRDKTVGIWDLEADKWVKGFSGHLAHKDAVSSVAFKKASQQLYSGSFDRTVKVYDLTPGVMGYVETLFGHQDHILALDALRGDNCLSVGARDKTARYWKILDETQLVFRGGGRSRIREVLEGGLQGDEEGDINEDDDMDVDGTAKRKKKAEDESKQFIEGSLECIAMLDETTFLTGGDSGSICLWNTQKKKPIFTQPVAHGFHETHSSTEGLLKSPRWITALGTLRYSDLFFSGSWEGNLRIWKLDSKLKSFSLIGAIPAPGVVNSLQILQAPKTLSKTASWISSPQSQSTSTSSPSKDKDDSTLQTKQDPKLKTKPKPKDDEDSILVVVGLGQEHRLGRWLKVTENGAVNSTQVLLFSPSS
ncbi:Rnu3ip2 protein [Coprinopsis cinerea okayama7|uniref:Rnu3ip2 protein n=1 Tax=Coprinopsis cinerea (strain Okayama-7 / 130 / ATCC MYA-4618 / FGSC 9003) TaxID=240176 RepID=A8NZD4_COPC7|nr:Rnu3ip2 protein [Coprinopsis cinerea okayama7\|eukprot:XP_001837653.2 Rnu3ip2 protein [Coprinopsis cinerea okayama7\